jgi:hypothetical protein
MQCVAKSFYSLRKSLNRSGRRVGRSSRQTFCIASRTDIFTASTFPNYSSAVNVLCCYTCIPGNSVYSSYALKFFGRTVNLKLETPVSCATRLRDFRAERSSITPISSVFPSVSTRRFDFFQ